MVATSARHINNLETMDHDEQNLDQDDAALDLNDDGELTPDETEEDLENMDGFQVNKGDEFGSPEEDDA